MSTGRQKGTNHIGSAIRKMLESYNLTRKFDEASLMEAWPRLVGPLISKHTTKLNIRDKVLFVRLDSPGVKHDLRFSKAKILEILQQEYGSDLVGDVVFM
ncbi:MAG: DUF721 domain-containing protein [Cyclobacteriaceae bacterium]